jgi:hypothetical protein
MKKSATAFRFVWRRAERLGANECAGANKLRQTQRCACKVVEPMQCAKGGVGRDGGVKAVGGKRKGKDNWRRARNAAVYVKGEIESSRPNCLARFCAQAALPVRKTTKVTYLVAMTKWAVIFVLVRTAR